MIDRSTNSELKRALEKKYQDLFASTSASDRKYYNPISLQNFIHYFDDIRNEKDQEWVYSNLDDYFDKCSNLSEVDRDTAKSLYMTHLHKIGGFYHDYLDFSATPSVFTHAIMFVLAFLILAILLDLLNALFFILPIYLVNLGFVLYKKKRRRAYGIFY